MNSHEPGRPQSGPRAKNIRRDSGRPLDGGISFPAPPTLRRGKFDDGIVAVAQFQTPYFLRLKAANETCAVDLFQKCRVCGMPCRQEFCLKHAREHTQEERRKKS